MVKPLAQIPLNPRHQHEQIMLSGFFFKLDLMRRRFNDGTVCCFWCEFPTICNQGWDCDCFQPDMNEQSNRCLAAKKAKSVRSAGKVMTSVFWAEMRAVAVGLSGQEFTTLIPQGENQADLAWADYWCLPARTVDLNLSNSVIAVLMMIIRTDQD